MEEKVAALGEGKERVSHGKGRVSSCACCEAMTPNRLSDIPPIVPCDTNILKREINRCTHPNSNIPRVLLIFKHRAWLKIFENDSLELTEFLFNTIS